MERDGWLRVEVRHLAALRAVAQEGSFGAAATRLGYTQSAVSQQIATLERAVGERLVERPGGPRKISLTEAGRCCCATPSGSSPAWRPRGPTSRRSRRGQRAVCASGRIRASAHGSCRRVMGRFVAERPGVEVVLTESGSDRELLDQLERGEIDLSFTVLPLPEGPSRASSCMRDPYVLMVAADHPLALPAARRTLAALADLLDDRLPALHRRRAHRRVPARRRASICRWCSARTTTARCRASSVRGWRRPSCRCWRRTSRDERVAVLPMGASVPERRIAIAWHRDRALSPASRAFIDVTRAPLRRARSPRSPRAAPAG